MKTLFKNGIPFRGFSGASEEYVNFARFGRQFLATADPIDWDSNFQDNGIVGEHSGDPRSDPRISGLRGLLNLSGNLLESQCFREN